MTAALLWTGKREVQGQESPDGEIIRRYSEIYDRTEELPAPEEYIRDSEGREYRLTKSRIVTSPVTGRQKYLAGEVVYAGVMRSDTIPDTAVMEVYDAESGITFETELPLKETEYENERWESGFPVIVTFHSYGADSYTLGDIRIRHCEERPPLEKCSQEILKAAGLSQEAAEIESFAWNGESYCGENGELCRDALASVKRKVWDCRAVYEGKAALPDYDRYRLLNEYEPVAEKNRESCIKEETEEEDSKTVGKAEDGTGIRQVLWYVAGVTASISILLLFFLVVGFKKLRKAAKKADNMQP